ncbi:hypothetical protein EVAR_77110_1 [Eumeta japonica]|uniref:Uncharacterized protein n=1 Tax=Eumeta variegata TaxID=151549 RepID=A0A4C1T1K4_EUMVA|nr:hypothetical protein EVAR_77110_1 [Eumeta japonica]
MSGPGRELICECVVFRIECGSRGSLIDTHTPMRTCGNSPIAPVCGAVGDSICSFVERRRPDCRDRIWRYTGGDVGARGAGARAGGPPARPAPPAQHHGSVARRPVRRGRYVSHSGD